mgnify:CR=1
SLSAFLIRSDKIDAVSSSQPLARSVFLANSNISSKVKDMVLIYFDLHFLHKPKNSKLYLLYFIPESSEKLDKYFES